MTTQLPENYTDDNTATLVAVKTIICHLSSVRMITLTPVGCQDENTFTYPKTVKTTTLLPEDFKDDYTVT
jgi:hypothetical protein